MIRILCRTTQDSVMTELTADQLASVLKVKRNLIWVDLCGDDTAAYQPLLIDVFGFHPLAVEDALVETHLPKIDDWDEYLYRVLYGVDFDQAKLEVDSHEVDVFLGPTKDTLPRIFTLKRAAIQLRRILSPQREVLNRLARDEYRAIDAKDRIYFRGVYDHLVRLHDINEGVRDLIGGALDIYLSAASNRLNEVMRILTLVTVLGLPLTFLTGFFGMNFFGSSYELPAPSEGWLLFIIAMLTMILTPLVLYTLLKEYVRRKKL